MAYRNIIAAFGPAEVERVVVGAHYDAAGPLPGADDNASGVAGLIELAHLLAKSPPRLRVEPVAFALEDPPFFRTGHMGSAVHAHSLREKGVLVRALISPEMIGYFSDREGSQRLPSPLLKAVYPTRGDFITAVGKMDQGPLVRTVKKGPARGVHAARLLHQRAARHTRRRLLGPRELLGLGLRRRDGDGHGRDRPGPSFLSGLKRTLPGKGYVFTQGPRIKVLTTAPTLVISRTSSVTVYVNVFSRKFGGVGS